MPFNRATLSQLRADALQDLSDAPVLDATTGQLATVTMFEQSPLRGVGFAIAGGVYSCYGYLDWIAQQSTPWGATDERAAGWGALKRVTRKPATAAAGSEVITGPANTDIPAGTTLNRGDGVAYITLADAGTGATGSATVAFAAVVPGAAGNAAAGVTLSFGNPIAGLGAFVTANPITGGAEIETQDAFKARYLLAYAEPPAGGSATDYPQWALDVPGVTRAWCAPLGAGAGTVVVYTMWDVANAPLGGFPQGSDGVATDETRDAVAQGDQLTVANAIYPLRPVTALVYSVSPVAWPVPFVINNLGRAATPAIQALIEAALDAMFLRLGSPLGDAAAVIYPSAWEAAIGNVTGVGNFVVLAPAPTVPLIPAAGSLAVRGTVTLNA